MRCSPVQAAIPGNIALLRESDMLLVTEGKGPGWELDPHRKRPHKTHANTALLRSNAGPERTGPAQQFRYRGVGEPAAEGEAMAGFDLHIQQVFVQWRWDPATGAYLRAQDLQPHILGDGHQVTTENVAVVWLDYNPSNTDRRSPDGQTTGSNPVMVFTGGRMITGTWTRADRLNPFTFTRRRGCTDPADPWQDLRRAVQQRQGRVPRQRRVHRHRLMPRVTAIRARQES